MDVSSSNSQGVRVPKLRFPGFEGEWKKTAIRDLLDFQNGINAAADKYGSGIKYISVSDILNLSYITYDSIKGLVDVDEKTLNNFSVNYGDILFQRSSETQEDIGHSNVYLDSKTATFGGFVIRGKKIGEYNPVFFKHLLDTPAARKVITRLGAGAQHYNIGQDSLRTVQLYFPTIKEQRKISELLLMIDKKIILYKKYIELLKSYKRGALQTVFCNIENNEYVALSKVCKIKKGTQLNKTNMILNGYYYVLNGGTSPSGYTNSFNALENTISISEGGNSCGFVSFNSNKFWSGGHCYTLENVKYINSQYLYQYLKFHELDIMSLRVGSGLPNIQKKAIENFQILLLSDDIQKKIGETFSIIDINISTQEQQLALIRKLKDSLIQKMFI